MRKSHKDVEFAVGDRYFKTIDEATVQAVGMSLSNGDTIFIDILVHGPQGAKWFAGDDGVEQYMDDPEASVFERIAVKAESYGRVP